MQQAEYRCLAKRGVAIGVCLTAVLSASSAHAAVTISTQPTQNMSCSNGVCAPTATAATLNTGDLETLLASGNVTVTTRGAGVEADNIAVKSSVSWATVNTLSLAAHRSVAVDAPVSVVGLSGLSLQTGAKNGTLSFGKKGSVGFSNLSSQLSINGVAYTLVGNIKTLATDVAANPSGAYALGGTYDASADGTYTSSPIGTIFKGTFEGLGNTFLNLSVNVSILASVGLFAEIGATGIVRDLGLVNAAFVLPKDGGGGILTGWNVGAIENCYAMGKIKGGGSYRYFSQVGGLAGQNDGTITKSYAAAIVSGGASNLSGGLVALNDTGVISDSHATGNVSGATAGGLAGRDIYGGTITGSYATGNVLVVRDQYGGGSGGGLVGYSQGSGTIANSYATGAVAGPNGQNIEVGGLVGFDDERIHSSYSTGAVTAGTGAYVGGLIGSARNSLIDTDWDTDKSGITNLSQGAGNIPNYPGITGLSTAQFQSGLPPGFDPRIWAEKSNINGGLPYLVANPPPK